MQLNVEPGSAVVPARVLQDPAELERYLICSGYPEIFGDSSNTSTPQTTTEDERFLYRGSGDDISQRPPMAIPNIDLDDLLQLPETEKLQVELTKDANGLGITIAGYVCEKEELSGIFVKSVSPGSAADMSGRIRVNDRIIEVDGQSLQGFSNHQAVELLKKSGQVVNLRLERYLRGPKFEQLQQAIAANDKIPSSSLPATPSRSHLNSTTAATSQRNGLISPSYDDMEPIAAPEAFLNDITTTTNTASTSSSPLPMITNLSTFGSGKKLIAVRDSIDGTPKIIPTDVSLSSIGKSESELTEQEVNSSYPSYA